MPVFCGYPRIALQPYSYTLLPTQSLGYAQNFSKLRDTDEPPAFEVTTNLNQRFAFNRLSNLASMSSTEATQSDKYALVSSFYGPGAVGGWYLTAFACLISFSLHPRQRRRDSITADFIAVLTFPTVAAANLITQVRSYPKEGTKAAQNAASIEATLIVTETFLAIDVILFLLTVGFKCVRRPCLIATVGLFCFSTECYVYFSPFVYPAVGQQLDRLFLIDFGDILISVMTVLIICVICALGLVALFFSMLPRQPHARPPEQAVEATRRDWVLDEGAMRRELKEVVEEATSGNWVRDVGALRRELEQEAEVIRRDMGRDFKQSDHAKALMVINTVLLSFALVASMFPLSSNALSCLPYQFWPQIRQDFIPRSNTSIKELDQAAALLAGASVLGFSLYSIADAYYRAWLSKTRAMTQQQGIELRTLNHNQTPRL